MKKYIRSTQLLSDKNILVIITFFFNRLKEIKKIVHDHYFSFQFFAQILQPCNND